MNNKTNKIENYVNFVDSTTKQGTYQKKYFYYNEFLIFWILNIII